MVEEVTTDNTYYEVGGERKKTVPFNIELREWVIIAHKIGLVFFDTLQDIRLLTEHQQGMVCGSFENLAIYQFNELSTDADDGESVIKPDNAYETGRWLLKAKLDSGYNELVFKELRVQFPSVGNENYLYIARDTRYIYWWNPNTNTYHNAITNFATQSLFSENSGKLGGELPTHYYNLARLIDCITAGQDISIDTTSVAGKIIINYTGSGGGLSFSDLVNILQEGDNIELDVDTTNETITINSTVTPTVTYIRRSDYVLLDRKSFIGIAVSGSLETDAVWTIWVTITNTAGEVVSNTQYTNKKWSERGLL